VLLLFCSYFFTNLYVLGCILHFIYDFNCYLFLFVHFTIQPQLKSPTKRFGVSFIVHWGGFIFILRSLFGCQTDKPKYDFKKKVVFFRFHTDIVRLTIADVLPNSKPLWGCPTHRTKLKALPLITEICEHMFWLKLLLFRSFRLLLPRANGLNNMVDSCTWGNCMAIQIATRSS